MYEAAQGIQFCDLHDADEIVLLVRIAVGNLDGKDEPASTAPSPCGEVELLKRFVHHRHDGVAVRDALSIGRWPTVIR